jgi:uncharacterized protein (TIGR00251 family)
MMASLPKNMSPFTATEGGVHVAVRLTPKGGGSRLEGPETGADGRVWLKVRVSAPPEKGKANAALIKLLAKAWALPPRDLEIVSGETARQKKIHVSCDPVEGMARLTKWLGENFN